MNCFYPQYYVLNIKSFEGKPNLEAEARVMEIIKRCELDGKLRRPIGRQ